MLLSNHEFVWWNHKLLWAYKLKVEGAIIGYDVCFSALTILERHNFAVPQQAMSVHRVGLLAYTLH